MLAFTLFLIPAGKGADDGWRLGSIRLLMNGNGMMALLYSLDSLCVCHDMWFNCSFFFFFFFLLCFSSLCLTTESISNVIMIFRTSKEITLDQNVDEVYVAYSPRLYTVLSRSSFASRARLGEIYPSRCRRRGRPPQPTDARLTMKKLPKNTSRIERLNRAQLLLCHLLTGSLIRNQRIHTSCRNIHAAVGVRE